ncbi:MAG TPA: peptidoglycan-binding protein [Caulobacteraceae bacterium]|nr:peptidoglycan-binding protein [Caulobacteraceae bacterium]
MDRRLFLLLSVAGVANPGSTPLRSGGSAVVQSGDPNFDAWAADYIARAIQSGLPAPVVDREFRGLTPDRDVVARDSQQPEFSKPISEYVQSVAADGRVDAGRKKMAATPALGQIEARFGPPPEILVSIWGVESAFGRLQGDFDVLRSLASLAAAGRRRAWAESQLDALIRIIASGKATRAELRGSWAGAMGQTQLEPDTYLDLAIDLRGGDRPDVWRSADDALASAAHLLQNGGWRRGEPWQREVRLPSGFDYGLAEGPTKSAAAWDSQDGIKPATGAGWAHTDADTVLILPAGAAGPAFLAYPNHFVIRKYNNSLAYALGVGLLADRIAGRSRLAQPWPKEEPLSIADRVGAQSALNKLGYDAGPADGQVGIKTRVALRAWQKSQKLPADGYLTPHVAGVLVAQASRAP